MSIVGSHFFPYKLMQLDLAEGWLLLEVAISFFLLWLDCNWARYIRLLCMHDKCPFVVSKLCSRLSELSFLLALFSHWWRSTKGFVIDPLETRGRLSNIRIQPQRIFPMDHQRDALLCISNNMRSTKAKAGWGSGKGPRSRKIKSKALWQDYTDD